MKHIALASILVGAAALAASNARADGVIIVPIDNLAALSSELRASTAALASDIERVRPDSELAYSSMAVRDISAHIAQQIRFNGKLELSTNLNILSHALQPLAAELEEESMDPCLELALEDLAAVEDAVANLERVAGCSDNGPIGPPFGPGPINPIDPGRRSDGGNSVNVNPNPSVSDSGSNDASLDPERSDLSGQASGIGFSL